MKKLLELLGAITITSSAMLTLIAAAPNQKQNLQSNLLNSELNYWQTNNLENLKRNKRENNEKIENWYCFSCPNRLVLKIKHQTWSFLKAVQKVLSKDKFNKLVFSIIKYFTKINKSADTNASNYISDDDINILVDVIVDNFDDINIVFENKNNDNIGLFIRTNRNKYWENNYKSDGFWGAYPNVDELKQDAASYHNGETTKFFSEGLAALAILSLIILSDGTLAPLLMSETEILAGEVSSEVAVMALEEGSAEIEVIEMEEFSQTSLEEEAEELETDGIRQRKPWSQRNIDTFETDEMDAPYSSSQTPTQRLGNITEEETTNSNRIISINSLNNIINGAAIASPLSVIMDNNLGSSPISSSSIDIILFSNAEETEATQMTTTQVYLPLNGTMVEEQLIDGETRQVRAGGTRQEGDYWCGPAVAEAMLRYISDYSVAPHNNLPLLNNITSQEFQENMARNYMNTNDHYGTTAWNFTNGINNYITQNRISTNQYEMFPILWQSDMIANMNFIHSSIVLSLQNNMPVAFGYFGSQNINEDDDHSHFILINGIYTNYTADNYPNETLYTYMDPATGSFSFIDSSILLSYLSPREETMIRINGLGSIENLQPVARNLYSGFIIYSLPSLPSSP